MELTKEHFDELTSNLAIKHDLGAPATRDQVEGLSTKLETMQATLGRHGTLFDTIATNIAQ